MKHRMGCTMKRLAMGCLTVWMALNAAYAQHDKHKANQWASMEHKQWEFTPDDYYYSRVWRKILNLPWPLKDVYGWVPGTGYHDKGTWVPFTGIYIKYLFNPYALAAGHWDAVYQADNYVNETWRMMTPLRGAAAGEAVIEKNKSNDEKDYWSNIRKLDVATLGDRMGILSGLTGPDAVTGTERQESMDIVNENIEDIEDEKLKQNIQDEYDALQEQNSVIDNTYMDNAKKVNAKQQMLQEYKVLAQEVTRELVFKKLNKMAGKRFNGLIVFQDSVGHKRDSVTENRVQQIMRIIEQLNLDKL